MKMKLLIIFTLLLANCSNSQQPPLFKALVKEQNEKYQGDKKHYFTPVEIFTHFPDNISESYPVGSSFSLDDQYNAYRYFFLLTTNNNSRFLKKNENKAKTKAIKFFTPLDTAQYFVIPKMPYYKIEKLFMNKTPIPDFILCKKLVVNGIDSVYDSQVFNQFFSTDFPCGLSEGYDIYIIDSQNRYKTYAEKYNNIFASLPRTKNTGFTSGVCVNKKINVIFFWTIIF